MAKAMNGIIYKATNRVNGKVYVGRTLVSIRVRRSVHARSNSLLGRAIRKYGLSNFEFIVLDEAESLDALNRKEQIWIEFFDCLVPNGYNLTAGGEGLGKYQHKNSTRLKMSLARKGWVPSLETLRRMSEAQKLRGKHRPTSEKTRKLISKALKGKPNGWEGKHLSKEHRLKISLAHVGMKATKETIRKLSKSHIGKSNSMRGKKFSKDFCTKVSEGLKRKYREGNFNPRLGAKLSKRSREKISNTLRETFAARKVT